MVVMATRSAARRQVDAQLNKPEPAPLRGETSAKGDGGNDPLSSAFAALAGSNKQIQELAEVQRKFFESMLNAAPQIIASATSSALALTHAVLLGLGKPHGATTAQGNGKAPHHSLGPIEDFDLLAKKVGEAFAAAAKAAVAEHVRKHRPVHGREARSR
jgi:hypothetical protein